MRIPGFTKLMFQEQTQACSLKDCSVVIDGQNYFYQMYEQSKLPFVFGCEANRYAKYLKNKLNMFQKANVKCYIVFKGGHTDMQTTINKFKVTNFDFDCNYEFILPIFTKDVCKLVLDEKYINYTVCVTEAKDDCVSIAQHLGCPVISFDMEYCFKKAAYIPYCTMNYNTSTKSIDCRQYKLQNFLQQHSLTEEKMALLAALTDTLLFQDGFFNSLLQTWNVIHDNSYMKIKQLIKILSQNTEDTSREHILKAISGDDNKQKFCDYYARILGSMRKNGESLVVDYFMNKLSEESFTPDRWFEKGVAFKRIPIPYINLYKWKVLQNFGNIVDKHADSILIPIDIIKYAYNLLTDFKTDVIKLYQDADKYININTVDQNIKKPRYKNCNESVFERGWLEVKRLKLFDHFLKENKIKISVLHNIFAEEPVLFAALVYFARKKMSLNVDVTREVYALLVSYVMVKYVFNQKYVKYEVGHDISEADGVEAKRVAAKYFKCDRDEAKRIFNGSILTSLTELNLCILHMNYLNVLCGSTYRPIKYNIIYNGTFVYKLLYDMQEQDSFNFIQEMLEPAPSVWNFIYRLISAYEELLHGN